MERETEGDRGRESDKRETGSLLMRIMQSVCIAAARRSCLHKAEKKIKKESSL